MMKIMLIHREKEYSRYKFEDYKNCDDLVEYLRSLNIYKGEMRQVFQYPNDMLYFFASHFREVPETEELNYLIMKYPHLLKVSDEN